ncbi:hypothetical protein BE15_35135 [Sorangium cellulosum]|uniref:Protein kinase domain-containing protein n=1 Tax=Sorangium cellulosum TaxID=56 RepID=A0A150QDZ6_SORCE|nr:hypothetical protein BE15_35135 [Sorangium cellulosum]
MFALGVVLWELTTNQRLFRMDTDLDTLEKVQACVVPPPSTIVPDYPIELESVVMKALAKHRHDRFQTAREFSRALQSFLMRSGVFVGSEEVAQFVQQVFADRIQKREAHLAWAAEVTSTINVEQVRGRMSTTATDSVGLRSRGRDTEPQRLTPPQLLRHHAAPASGIAPVGRALPRDAADKQMVATSLMDDDEDVPTTVATREHAEPVRPPLHERPTVRPAAGRTTGPAAAVTPPPLAVQPAPAGRRDAPPPYQQVPARAQGGHSPPSLPQPPTPFPPPLDLDAGGHAPPPPRGLLDRGMESPLASTLALPPQAASPPVAPVPKAVSEASRHAHANRALAYGASPHGHGAAPSYALPRNGQGYAPAPPLPGASPAPAFPPPPSTTLGQAQQFAPAAPAQPPQSQIETALSLPRPDPAAIWAATQDAVSKGNGRNTLVLLAVIALTALCVIGIGALIYMKTRTVQPFPAHGGDVLPAPAPATGAATTGELHSGARPWTAGPPRPDEPARGTMRG